MTGYGPKGAFENSMSHMISKLNDPVRIAELAPAETLKKLGLKAGKVMCDIGAGTGIFTFPAAGISGSRVYAVDISPDMRAYLTAEAKGLPVEVCASVSGVPQNGADIVLLCAVLHEISDVPGLLSGIKRILKKGGTLAIIEFHKSETTMGPPMHMRIAETELISRLARHGFTVSDRFVIGQNYYCAVFTAAE